MIDAYWPASRCRRGDPPLVMCNLGCSNSHHFNLIQPKSPLIFSPPPPRFSAVSWSLNGDRPDGKNDSWGSWTRRGVARGHPILRGGLRCDRDCDPVILHARVQPFHANAQGQWFDILLSMPNGMWPRNQKLVFLEAYSKVQRGLIAWCLLPAVLCGNVDMYWCTDA